MKDKDEKPTRDDLLESMLETAKKTTEGLKTKASSPDKKAQASGSGSIAGAMDLSDPVREVYLQFVKLGEMSLQEFLAASGLEDKDMVPIYVKILVRQGYLNRHKEGNVIKYSPKVGERRKVKVAEDIWKALK